MLRPEPVLLEETSIDRRVHMGEAAGYRAGRHADGDGLFPWLGEIRVRLAPCCRHQELDQDQTDHAISLHVRSPNSAYRPFDSRPALGGGSLAQDSAPRAYWKAST